MFYCFFFHFLLSLIRNYKTAVSVILFRPVHCGTVISKYFSFCQRTVICNNQIHYLAIQFHILIYFCGFDRVFSHIYHNVCTVNISCCNGIGTVSIIFYINRILAFYCGYCIYKICRFCNLESKVLMKRSILTGSSNYISGTLTFKSNCSCCLLFGHINLYRTCNLIPCNLVLICSSFLKF